MVAAAGGCTGTAAVATRRLQLPATTATHAMVAGASSRIMVAVTLSRRERE